MFIIFIGHRHDKREEELIEAVLNHEVMHWALYNFVNPNFPDFPDNPDHDVSMLIDFFPSEEWLPVGIGGNTRFLEESE